MSADAPETPLVLTPAQARQVIGEDLVSERWLKRAAGERLIPCTYVGRRPGFTRAQCAEIVEQFSRSPKRRNGR